MRMYVGDQEALNAFELEELAHGFEDPLPRHFRELFLGAPGDAAKQRAARIAVAGDVLAELLAEGETDEVSLQNAHYAQQLMEAVPLRSVTDTSPSPRVRKAA
jgi:hypothetical protein